MLVVLLLIGVVGSRLYDWADYQLGAPVSSKSEPVTVKVTEGEAA